METPKRYNPLMVTLHWLTFILLFGAGLLTDEEGGGGGSPINIHIILGALLLVVVLVRIVVRLVSKRPKWADTGNYYLNLLGELVHYGLYLAMLFILGMGVWIAFSRNLFAYALGTGSATHGVRFVQTIHHLGWIMALGLIGLHVAGALYHQYIIKDNLLARMWYGKSN